MLMLYALLFAAQADVAAAPVTSPVPSGVGQHWIAPGRRLAYRVQVTFDDEGRATACRFVIFLPPTEQPAPTPQQICELEMEIWAKFPAKPGAAGTKYINRYLPARIPPERTAAP